MFYCKCLLMLVTLSTIGARSSSKKYHILALKEDPNHGQYVFSPIHQRNPTYNPNDDNLRPIDTIIHFEKPKTKKKIQNEDDIFGKKGYVYITQPKEQDDEIYDLRTQNYQDARSFEDLDIDTSLTPDWREKEWGPMPYNDDCRCWETHRRCLMSPAKKKAKCWTKKRLRNRELVAAIDAGSLPKGNRLRRGKVSLSAIEMRDADEPIDGPLYRKSDSIDFDLDNSANPDRNSIDDFIKALWQLTRNNDYQPKHQEPIHDAEVKITFESDPGVGRAGKKEALVLPIP